MFAPCLSSLKPRVNLRNRWPTAARDAKLWRGLSRLNRNSVSGITGNYFRGTGTFRTTTGNAPRVYFSGNRSPFQAIHSQRLVQKGRVWSIWRLGKSSKPKTVVRPEIQLIVGNQQVGCNTIIDSAVSFYKDGVSTTIALLLCDFRV